MKASSRHTDKPPALPFDIPDRYDEAMLRVLPCSPFRLFVYWEHPAIGDGASCRIAIRLTGSGISAQATDAAAVELELDARVNECYLDIPVPGRGYDVELIRIGPDGERATLLSTRPTIPPPLPTPVENPVIEVRTAGGVPRAIAVETTGTALRYDRRPIPGILHLVGHSSRSATSPSSV